RLIIAAQIPYLVAEGKINSLKDPAGSIQKVRLENPVLDFTIKEIDEFSEENESSEKRTRYPAIDLVQPDLHLKRQTNDSLFTLFSSKGGHISSGPIQLKDGSMHTDKIDLSLNNLIVLPDKIKLGAGQFALRAENFSFNKFIQAQVEHV